MSRYVPSDITKAFIARVGRNLRVARKRRRKTIKQLAEMVGTSMSTIKRVESGDPGVKFTIYLAIIEVFQLYDVIKFADPDSDTIGMALEKQRMPQRVRQKMDKRLDF